MVPDGFGVTAMTITMSKILIGRVACSGNHTWRFREKSKQKEYLGTLQQRRLGIHDATLV